MRIRPVVGFLVAPAAPLALAALYSAVAGVNALGPTAIIVLYGYAIALLFGVPAYLLFRRFRWLRWWQVVAAGAGIGVLLPLLITLGWTIDGGFHAAYLTLVAYGLVLGSLCASVFWVVCLRGDEARRDEMTANDPKRT